MTVTSIYFAQKAQDFLTKAAAARNVSVEKLASEILAEGIQVNLGDLEMSHDSKQSYSANSLAGLQPYAFYATPEESAFSCDEWTMETEEG
jgi:hypothetical protein